MKNIIGVTLAIIVISYLSWIVIAPARFARAMSWWSEHTWGGQQDLNRTTPTLALRVLSAVIVVVILYVLIFRSR